MEGRVSQRAISPEAFMPTPPLSRGTSWPLATGVAAEELEAPDGNGRLERGCPEVHVSASSAQQRTACFVQLRLSRRDSAVIWGNKDFQGRAEGHP